MIAMSPAFAHESKVGPVFDLTGWSGSKNIWMGLVGTVFATAAFATAIFLWQPKIMEGNMPAGSEQVISDVLWAHRAHPWEMRGGIAFAGIFGWICGVAALSGLRDGFATGYYFRAGPGGLSLRLPQGVSWRHGGLISNVLELDLPWDDIDGLTVTQVKQLGSMSRNAGNLGAELKIATRSGRHYDISLNGLEAAAYLIHERLMEAQEMVLADMEEPQPQEAEAAH